ncbi:hypothetical protein VP01_3458g1 [Puccinia sorghi]|uniref:Uncharacterized protein n=1 Tax=Puccinia sorghi TaxID=27349 RepID=A0A0L6UW51_9BASI|nr:hypothetical protein VP01_3458g1 [Puccinia sorghi]
MTNKYVCPGNNRNPFVQMEDLIGQNRFVVQINSSWTIESRFSTEYEVELTQMKPAGLSPFYHVIQFKMSKKNADHNEGPQVQYLIEHTQFNSYILNTASFHSPSQHHEIKKFSGKTKEERDKEWKYTDYPPHNSQRRTLRQGISKTVTRRENWGKRLPQVLRLAADEVTDQLGSKQDLGNQDDAETGVGLNSDRNGQYGCPKADERISAVVDRAHNNSSDTISIPLPGSSHHKSEASEIKSLTTGKVYPKQYISKHMIPIHNLPLILGNRKRQALIVKGKSGKHQEYQPSQIVIYSQMYFEKILNIHQIMLYHSPKHQCYYSALKRKSSISEPQTNLPYRHNEQISHPQLSQGSHHHPSFQRTSSEMLAAQQIQQYQYIQKHQKIQATPESYEHTEIRRRNSISLDAQAIQEYRYFEQNKNSQCSEDSYAIEMKISMSAPQPNLQFSNHEQDKTPQVFQQSHKYSTFPKISPINHTYEISNSIPYNIFPNPGEVKINQQNKNIMHLGTKYHIIQTETSTNHQFHPQEQPFTITRGPFLELPGKCHKSCFF